MLRRKYFLVFPLMSSSCSSELLDEQMVLLLSCFMWYLRGIIQIIAVGSKGSSTANVLTQGSSSKSRKHFGQNVSLISDFRFRVCEDDFFSIAFENEASYFETKNLNKSAICNLHEGTRDSNFLICLRSHAGKQDFLFHSGHNLIWSTLKAFVCFTNMKSHSEINFTETKQSLSFRSALTPLFTQNVHKF